jgi:hypothetical protein
MTGVCKDWPRTLTIILAYGYIMVDRKKKKLRDLFFETGAKALSILLIK